MDKEKVLESDIAEEANVKPLIVRKVLLACERLGIEIYDIPRKRKKKVKSSYYQSNHNFKEEENEKTQSKH